MSRKLCLCVVDSLRTDMLLRTAEGGRAPNFATLLSRGELIPDCVSAFPSVTPVASAEIATGRRADGHWVPGMNWYHRAERRYIEYGSSFEATRTFGLFRALYDTVYNMNMAHLSSEVETVFERLADAGIRTACTPFLIYRGRTRHELGLEGILRRAASTARFDHAVWGPDELFYGELYASRRVPCKPTLARPGTRDEYSGCVGETLARDDLYDFVLFSLPDNDHHCHSHGPAASLDSIAHADANFGRLVEASGGIEQFLATHAVILMADHAQSDVERLYDITRVLAEDWLVQEPNTAHPELAELAVSPTGRAAWVYLLEDDHDRAASLASRVRTKLAQTPGTDLIAYLDSSRADGAPVVAVERAGAVLRFWRGGATRDLRGVEWTLDGDPGVLELVERDGCLLSERYPDPLSRIEAALRSPFAGDLLISCAPGWECADWGGQAHLGGGSHGSLDAADSLAPLLAVGLERFDPAARRQWTLGDVAGLIYRHFEIEQ